MAELRKYGVQTTFYFPLIDRGQADFEITPVAHAVGDSQFDKDGAGFGNTANAFAHRGLGIYSIVLTAAEMEAANIVITIVDQTAPKAWEDQAVLIDTYGHGSAAHAFDLDTASQVVASVTGAVGSVTGAVGSVTGAVGSVTGAVGSVAGDVGGDVLGAVVGAVASVTGAVGSVTGAVGSVAGNVDGNVTGNVTGTLGGMTAAALADFFDTDSGETAASAVDGSVVKETGFMATGSPYHWYVTKAGNDANGGLSWVDAKLTIEAARAASADGDTIHIGPGTFDETVDASGDEVHFIGSGPSTILTQAVGQTTLKLGSNSGVTDMAVTNTYAVAGLRYAIYASGKDHLLLQRVTVTSVDIGVRFDSCQNVRIRDSAVFASEVGIRHANSDSIDTLLIERCLVHITGWATCSCHAIYSDGWCKIASSTLIAESAAGGAFYAAGVDVVNRPVEVYDTHIEVDGGANASAYGVRAGPGADGVSVIDCDIATAVVAGTAYDLNNLSGDVLAVGMTRYDRAKTNGTITMIPVGSVLGDVSGSVASVVGAVGSVAGNVDGNVTGNVAGNLNGNVVGTLGGMTAAALADFFTVDSGETHASAVNGSVVKETAGAWVGTGSNIFVLTIVDGGAAPIPGATASISTDAAGATMVVGPLTSDAAGEIIFLLNNGTYYLWKQMAGYTFTHPESHTVSAMALTHTSTGTAVGTAALTQWSINTLSAHLIGFFNQSRNAAGGTTPARLKDEVRNSLRYVWDVEDWRHEVDIATLALAADGTTIDLPQDYRKAGTTVLRDVDDALELPITESLPKWQRMDDNYEATDTGSPVLAAIIYDVTEDCDWLMKTTPASDAAYSFEFPYYKRCPVDLVAGHADLKGDADSIPMPTAFHQLWLLHAWWQIQEHFGKEDAPAKRAQDAYDKAYKAALDEQNETVSDPVHPTSRGYGAEELFGTDGWAGSDRDRLPDV